MKKLLKIITSTLLLCNNIAFAGEVSIAVAGNFYKPLQALVAEFESQRDDNIKISVGSSGKLYAQIVSGAPFDIFLSADQQRPIKLIEEKYAVTDSQYTYAKGKLILWSSDATLIDSQGKSLSSQHLKHLAIANPKIAPYGEQAIIALKNLELYDLLQPKFILGQSVGQVFQYVSSGSVEQGILAISQVMQAGKITTGSGWVIPSELYQPIKQDAVLLKSGQENPVAIAFLNYLKTERAFTIIRSFGYEVGA